MTLLPDYPPMKDCWYEVHLEKGRVVGPFKWGGWVTEASPDEEPGSGTEMETRLRFEFAGRDKGSMGFPPDEIKEVKVVCKKTPKKGLDVGDVPDVLNDIADALRKTNWPKPTTTDPGTGTGTVSGCIEGSVRRRLIREEVSRWVYRGTEEDDPYEHLKEGAERLKKRLKKKVVDRLWKVVSRYFDVGSLSHIKCYVYAVYKQTTVKVYEVDKCVNGTWEPQPKEDEESTSETARVRLHVGGNPCQDPAVHTPPKSLRDLDGIGDWGWVEER